MQAANEWAARQEELLLQERDEERAQLQQRLSACSAAQCEAAGLSLLRLQVQTSHTSLYGRVTISLAKRNNASLPAHQLKVGDEVEVFDTMQSQSSKKREGKNESSGSIPNSVCGVVCAVNATAIDFVCDDNQSDEVTSSWLSSSNSLRLNLRSSEANHKKLMDVLRTMRAVAGGRNNDCLESTPVIMDALFCERRQNDVLTEHSSKCNERSIKPFNQNLNDSQRSAISFALNDPFRISLIHGPPGTGKTTAVMEFILQAIVRGKRILVCAPSNVAVDNILERLVSEHYYYRPSDYHENAESGPSNAVKKVKVQAVRLGHPARMSSIVQNHCLDALVLCHEGTEIVKDVRKDIDAARKKLSKVSGKGDKTKRKELRSELKALRREARQREDKVVKDIVASRNVVLSTCVGAASRLIKSTPFDFVVIDEAAQALEVACWIPIMRCCEKLVLAGDHCQLPPTIKSADAAKNGLGVTLFERIIQHPVLKSCAKLLDTQYRMNNTICEWASEVMYDGRLVSHASNASITLRDLMPPPLNTAQPSDTDDLADSVMMLIDTAGCSMEEDGCSRDDSALTTLSYRNTHEAGIVKKHVQDLYALGLSPDQIGIITPYNGQLEYLRGILLDESRDDDGNEKLKGAKDRESSKRLEIRTVDGFQGGEKEAIILSLVRSNSLRQVGFLSEKRRINVAVTRAKRHVMVVCDSETVSNDPFIGGLLNYISAKGDVRSAMEFVEDEVSCSSEQTVLASTMKDLHSATVKQLMDPHLHAAPASSLCTEGKTVAKRKTKRQGAPQMSVPVPPRVKESPACKYDGMASFRNVMKELLRLLADPGGREVCGEGLRGGSIGGAAVRHFNADMAMKLSKVDDAKEKIRIFSELITPHGGAARERLRGLIGESLASVDMDMDDLLVFPASLSAQERQAVHSAADELNSHSVGRKLHHKTFEVPAVGSGRQLLVSVSPLHPPPATSPPDSSEDKEVLTVDLENESSDEERSLETEGAPSEIHSSKVLKTKKKKSGNKNKKAVKLGGDGSNSDTFSRIGGKKTFSKPDESVITNNADLDEIALLEMTIAENEKLKDYNKYRVRFQGAMPNNEKEVRSDALRSKIQKAKDARCPDKKASSGSTKKKLLKKPPRNFGGGRVGDQES